MTNGHAAAGGGPSTSAPTPPTRTYASPMRANPSRRSATACATAFQTACSTAASRVMATTASGSGATRSPYAAQDDGVIGRRRGAQVTATVRTADDGVVRVLTIDNPRKRNAFSG